MSPASPGELADGAEEVADDDDHDDEERQRMLESLRGIHDGLEANLLEWRGRLQELRQGRTPEELCMLTALSDVPAIEDGQKVELGEWLSDMLVERNYRRWPQHMDSLKCALKNAFPQVHMTPASARAEDFIYMLESHLLLEKRWETFVRARPEARRESLGGDLDRLSVMNSACSRERI